MKNKELSILLSKGLIFLGMAMAAAMSIWLHVSAGWRNIITSLWVMFLHASWDMQ